MSRPKGSIVVDEVILPITDIRLVGQQVEYVAQGVGPLPAADADSVSIHDQSGALVVHVHLDVTPIRWMRVLPGNVITLVLPFHWEHRGREMYQSGRVLT